jgi:ATP-dependent DNA ligase
MQDSPPPALEPDARSWPWTASSPYYDSGAVSLPLSPPLLPQLARSRSSLPEGPEWSYEPKWDGFRVIAFVDGKESYLQSRNGRPLSRYFPEIAFPRGRFVLDGELVVLDSAGKQVFDALQMRLHPAESRVRKLAEEMPARLVAFDLLAKNDRALLELPFQKRRAELEKLVKEPLALTPCTRERDEAEPWLRGAEGVVAKDLEAPYKPGERTGMIKVKRQRTIDCVVTGWREGKEAGTVGSLILGLYDGNDLVVVGHTSGFRASEKRELPKILAKYETGERGSGEPSRWSAGRDLEWIALRPALVAEVSFDHVSARRIRHGAAFQRWREDKDPRDCRIDQLDL